MSEENILFYILIFVCIAQLGIIVFLFFNRKKILVVTGKELKDDIENLRYSYNKLKAAYKRINDENEFLHEQIRDLNNNVKELESANVRLVDQKERLSQSKLQLEELQKQKDELFSIAIHDIKNPAAAIKGYIELLESYDLNAVEQHEIMQNLVDSSEQIMKLAQEISLVMAKEKSEPVIKKTNASIKKIIYAVCTNNLAYARKKNVKLINKTPLNLPDLPVDKGKIEEVIDNLVNNAIKFAPPETIVQVKSFYSASGITVAVEDNGTGIKDEDLNKVFTKGGITENKPTGDEPSSGLGLWIVKSIIENHGGSVSVESKYGVGSVFRIELPFK